MASDSETISSLETQILSLKKALAELQEVNQKLIIDSNRTVKGLSGDWEMDLKSQKISWSDEMYLLLGVGNGVEPNMKLFNDRLPPVCKSKLLGAINKVFVTGKEYSFEHYVHIGEEYKNALSELYPVLDEGGRPVKLIGKLTDTTAIKSSQKEIEKLSVIAAHTSNAVIAMDKETKIDWANNAFTYMTGYRLDEQNGKLFDDLIKTKPDDRSCKEIFETCFASENKFVREAQLISKKGNLIWVVISVSPILDYELNPESYVAIITDISERKKAEDELARKHKEITDSINYAERIQRSFLAAKELLDKNLKEYFIFFKPKDVVSGDFYWACESQNGEFMFLAADSTGHGVPGAIMSLLNIMSLEKAVETETSPDKILNHTRKTIIDRLKKDGSIDGGKDGMDCSLIKLNRDRSQLLLSAAQNPVWIIRNNELIVLKADKMPVGKHDKENVGFRSQTIDLKINDMIYLFTDGMPDQFGGPNGKKYKYNKLKEFLISVSGLPLQVQQQKLVEEFDNWKGSLEQVDDITIIGVRI